MQWFYRIPYSVVYEKSKYSTKVRITNNNMSCSPDKCAVSSKAKKFKGPFHHVSKYNEGWFSESSLQKYKDVITKSRLGESTLFLFVKYAQKMYHVVMVVQMMLPVIVGEKFTK